MVWLIAHLVICGARDVSSVLVGCCPHWKNYRFLKSPTMIISAMHCTNRLSN